jgi:flagellar biosynthetic protein FliR
MDILKALEHNLYIFFFVFFRILLLFFLFPVFSGTLLPTSLKIFISVILALALTPVVHFKLPHITSIYQLALIMLSDFVLIFLISLLFRIILAGLQVGGELVGYQMGFGITQTIDPISGFSLPVISQFVYIVFLLVFFTFDFHHYLIYFIYESFEKIPPGTFILSGKLGLFIIKKSKMIFEVGIKFLAPLMVFMMLIYVALSIIGRLIPQMNVLFVSFPLTIGLGMIFFGFMLILLPRIIRPYLIDYFKSLMLILHLY